MAQNNHVDQQAYPPATSAGAAKVSIADQMALTGGRSSGFDYMRISLAMLVALYHVPVISYGDGAERFFRVTHARIGETAILPMFFALSGFLVAGSLERCRTLSAFLGLRMIRIFPALAVEVILSALILGPFLTDLPLRTYFNSPVFHAYFLNIFGIVHLVLPGVFEHNPRAILTNAQLWTVPYELLCYVTLAVLAVAGLRRWRVAAPLAALVVTIGTLLYFGHKHNWVVEDIVGGTGVRNGLTLLGGYLFGVAIYVYRDCIPWDRTLFVACAVVGVTLLALKDYATFFAAAPLAYCTVFLGLTNIRRVWFLRGADYSYGVYLYHWVVFQTVMTFAPHSWLITVFVSLPLAILFAAFSWHLVEKPAMEWRRPLLRADAGGGASRVPLFLSAAVGVLVLLTVVGYHVQALLMR